MRKIYLFLGIAVFAVLSMPASGATKVKEFINGQDQGFVENQGQLGSPCQGNQIRYYIQSQGINLYCRPGTISFVFYNTQIAKKASEATGKPNGLNDATTSATRISTSRIDLVLAGSNPAAVIVPSDRQAYYENFYNTQQLITDVQAYRTITYRDIYPGIDMVLHAKPNGLKYEFIVRPGGKAEDIAMQWNGAEAMTAMENGGISYASQLGVLNDSRPMSLLAGGERVSSHFVLKNNRVGFAIKGYDHSKTLVIDPLLSWATYFGGAQSENGQVVAIDGSGNVYVTGYTYSSTGIAVSGAYQSVYTSNADVYIAKFTASGSLGWSTYYGGKADDESYGIATDKNGNIYIAGATGSDSGIATNGGWKSSFGGGTDVFIAKFSSSGSLTWATYFGGKHNDQANAVTTDASGNVIITGTTNDSTGIALGAGGYQDSLGGNDDAFVAKFIPSGKFDWSTYFGGAGYDGGEAVTTDANGNIYITGYTESTGLATSGAYQTSFGGVSNAFVAGFSATGALHWSTYFGGKGFDQANAIGTDASGDIFIGGFTGSKTGIATAGAYQTKANSASTGFLAKFTQAGAIKWSTYFGGNGQDVIDALAIDGQGNVVFTGYTGSTSAIATLGAWQPNIGTNATGTENAFLAKFSNAGNRIYGTYYGKVDDQGLGIAIDKKGNAYVSGQTSSTSGIATKGSYQPANAGNSDGFLAYFNLEFYAYDAGIGSILTPNLTPLNSFCMGRQPVTVEILNYGTAELDSVQIGWTLNSVAQTPYHWKGKLKPDSFATAVLSYYSFPIGKNTIKAWTIGPDGKTDSINFNDTSLFSATALIAPVPNAGGNHTICSGATIPIGASPVSGYSYGWYSKPKGYKSNSGNPTVSPDTTTVYYLAAEIASNGCTATDSAVITVRPALPLNAGKKQQICPGTTVPIGGTSASGITYSWSSTPTGFTSSSSSPDVSPLLTTTYYVTATLTSTGCTRTDSVTITVYPIPDATWAARYHGDTTILQATDTTMKTSGYNWTFGDGGSASGYQAKHIYVKNKPYLVNLSVTDSNGCANKYQSVLNVQFSGIDNQAAHPFSLGIYPNPFKEGTIIRYVLPEAENVGFTLSDMTGREIVLQPFDKQSSGKHEYNIDVLNLRLVPGVYVLKFRVGDSYQSMRLVHF